MVSVGDVDIPRAIDRDRIRKCRLRTLGWSADVPRRSQRGQHALRGYLAEPAAIGLVYDVQIAGAIDGDSDGVR